MKIKYREYLIEPCDNMVDRFNLYKIVERRKIGDGTKADPKGESYEGTTDIGYGMSLSYCFEKIVNQETQDSFSKEDIIEMKDYLNRWKEKKDSLVAYINSKTTIKIN